MPIMITKIRTVLILVIMMGMMNASSLKALSDKFSQDQTLLVTATTASEVFIWDYAKLRISRVINFSSPIHLTISPDNQTLLISNNKLNSALIRKMFVLVLSVKPCN